MSTTTAWKHLVRKPKSSYKQLFVKDRWVAARTLYGHTVGEGARTRSPLITHCLWRWYWKQSRTANPVRRKYKKIGSANKLLLKRVFGSNAPETLSRRRFRRPVFRTCPDVHKGNRAVSVKYRGESTQMGYLSVVLPKLVHIALFVWAVSMAPQDQWTKLPEQLNRKIDLHQAEHVLKLVHNGKFEGNASHVSHYYTSKLYPDCEIGIDSRLYQKTLFVDSVVVRKLDKKDKKPVE
jgi:hypothetical protein